MADTARLTQKQKEALEPLEAEQKANRKSRERLQRRLALESAIGFEENAVIKERIAELDTEYTNLSVKIAKIYAAESEIMRHMNAAMAEVEKARKIRDYWEYPIEI